MFYECQLLQSVSRNKAAPLDIVLSGSVIHFKAIANEYYWFCLDITSPIECIANP